MGLLASQILISIVIEGDLKQDEVFLLIASILGSSKLLDFLKKRDQIADLIISCDDNQWHYHKNEKREAKMFDEFRRKTK